MSSEWIPGNRVRLLENGDAFFPRVIDAIDAAREEVLVETFILFDDEAGRPVHAALCAAARRGVRVALTLDGYGSPDLPASFTAPLVEAGVRLRYFDPKRRLLGLRTNLFRRLHRKIVVVDGRTAFVGGINFSADHLAGSGETAKQDYTIEVEGPAVATIHAFARAALQAPDAPQGWERVSGAERDKAGDAGVRFVARDRRHPTDIEDAYIAAIRGAHTRVMIANAYFLPGYRLLHELHHAARRGIEVTLVLQGNPDMPIVANAARGLYPYLLGGGVSIVEYCQRPLHAKLALVDDDWATVGSSNLDPLSLSLNLEANVAVRDRAFNAHVHAHLQWLIEHHCRVIDTDDLPPRTPLRTLSRLLVFHTIRHLPAWAGLWPAHTPRVVAVAPGQDPPQ